MDSVAQSNTRPKWGNLVITIRDLQFATPACDHSLRQMKCITRITDNYMVMDMVKHKAHRTI